MHTAFEMVVGSPSMPDHRRVEVADLAQAVAAERQWHGVAAERGLAGVEHVTPVVERPGVGVGHHHLAERGPVADRPSGARAGVVVADVVEHEALDRVHRHPHAPALPRELLPVQLEARAVGLGDQEGLDVGADVVEVHATGIGGQGDSAAVAHLEHLARAAVGDHQQALDGPGPQVVAVALPHEQHRPPDPPSQPVDVLVEVGGRPGLHHDRLEVGDPPVGQRLLDADIAQHCGRGAQPLDGEDRGVEPLERAGSLDVTCGEVDDGLVGEARRLVDAHRHGPARHRPVGCPREHVALGRFLERHPRHDRLLTNPAAVEHEPDDSTDLVHRQRLERMHRSSRRSVDHLATLRTGFEPATLTLARSWISSAGSAPAPLSGLFSAGSSAQSAESAPLRWPTFNALNLYQRKWTSR